MCLDASLYILKFPDANPVEKLSAKIGAPSGMMQVHREVEQFGDVVFVKEKTNYKSILFKTYYVLEYAIKEFDVRYILKTDDDAFINVPALVHQLRQLCQSEVQYPLF